MPPVLAVLLLGLAVRAENSTAVGGAELVRAFSEVFAVRDVITDPDAAVVRQATGQLEALGVPRSLQLCAAAPEVQARVLMLAALGNLQLGLRDPVDWSVVAADIPSGQLVRVRSFSAVRFAVVESLLLVSILALGRAIWLKNL